MFTGEIGEIDHDTVKVNVDIENHDGPSVFVHITTKEAPVRVLVNGEEVYC